MESKLDENPASSADFEETSSSQPEFVAKLIRKHLKPKGTGEYGAAKTPEKKLKTTKRAIVTAVAARLPVQLPIWPENRRGMPNTFLRSALFTCRRHNDERTHHDNTKLKSTSDFELFYTGMELSQDDEDVYMEVVHRSRYAEIIDVVIFTAYDMLKSLGWGYSSKEYARLQESIHRLKNGSLKIVQDVKSGYSGSLIRKYAFDAKDTDGRPRYKVWLEPELVSQFQDDTYTQIKYEQRKKLGKSGLSKWLHSYYSTHANPHGMKTETIWTMSASKTKSLSKFRQSCKEAHIRLIEVGAIVDYEYDVKTDIHKVFR